MRRSREPWKGLEEEHPVRGEGGKNAETEMDRRLKHIGKGGVESWEREKRTEHGEPQGAYPLLPTSFHY